MQASQGSWAELDSAVQAELRRFEDEVRALERGEVDPDDFKRFRLENGVYGIRGTTDQHMIRVKVRFGRLSSDQLEVLAAIASDFTPSGQAHVTTRQDIQLHRVVRRDVPALLRRLALVGLTTREACGNTVRNVTACHFAGVSPSEVFDVTPYADAVSQYFLRNPVCQSMPRKFKIAFEGCTEDHVRAAINDIGAVAAVKDGQRGFRLYLGGGLGPIPWGAQLLEPFTPADLLVPTCEAIVRVFDRNGNRPDRNRARMKFVIKSWGFELFQKAVLDERRAVLATRSGRMPLEIPLYEELPPATEPLGAAPASGPDFERWRLTNVLIQKQPEWSAVIVRCPNGDITAAGLNVVAGIARRYGGGRIRTTITQNLVLRWVPVAALPFVHAELAAAGLAEGDAHRIADITRCPGAETCNLAITRSRGLANALGAVLQNGLGHAPELAGLTIKISGCPNSCGQHHIADLGFYGASRRVDGREVPYYLLLVGGGSADGQVTFGQPVLQLPARRIPEAVQTLLGYFQERRAADETFRDFVGRTGVPVLRRLLDPFKQVPPYAEAPEFYRDLGVEGEDFKVQLGQGECAG